MRRCLLGLMIVALALPASALARHRTIAPPGNSGVNQYVESIPTAGGNQPTSSVHQVTGVPGGGGSSGGSGGAGSGNAISPATAQTLSRQGTDGRGAAAVAQETAPAGSHARAAHRGSGRKHSAPATAPAPVPTTSGISPASAVVKALTGSSTSGGLGTLLPVILVVSLFGVTAVALLRRRRTTT